MKWLLVIFLFTGVSFGQSSYQKFLNKQVFKNIPENCKKQFEIQDTVSCSLFKKTIRLYKNYHNEQPTINAKIFSAKSREIFPPELLNFIEHEIAYFLLLDKKEFYKHSVTNKIFISDSLEQSLKPSDVASVIKHLSQFQIKSVNKHFQVVLTANNGNSIFVYFPASYQLIMDSDKIALQQKLKNDLMQTKIGHLTFEPDTTHLEAFKDILIHTGKDYLIKDLNNHTYFDKDKKLVFSDKYLRESFINLFVTDLSIYNDQKVDLHLKNYDDEAILQIKLSKLLSFFDNDFTRYVGIETFQDNRMHAVVIFDNKFFDFIHLLDIKLNVKDIFSNDKTIDMNLYSFIPSGNIKDFFGTNNSKDK